MGFPAQNSMSIFARGAFGSCSAKIYLYPSYKKKVFDFIYFNFLILLIFYTLRKVSTDKKSELSNSTARVKFLKEKFQRVNKGWDGLLVLYFVIVPIVVSVLLGSTIFQSLGS